MVFNSAAFVVFLTVVFAIYWLYGRKNVRTQNLLLIAAGCVFYGNWDWRFLGLLVASGLGDYFIASSIGKTDNEKIRKRWMYLSLLLNIGVLFYFKYFNFFAETFAALFTADGQAGFITANIILPLGISYYTFLKFGYILDVWRGKIPPERNAVNYFAFLLFFPYMLSGPVERARNMFPQLAVLRIFNRDLAVAGLRIILWGFFKKVVIADRIGQVIDPVFAQSDAYSGAAVALACVLYHVQLYADFSGYSDIARGVAQLFGIKIINNFDRPFYSPSLRKYWRRWHISVSTWFNEYLFTPLAIETRNWGSFGMYFSILVTFTAIGLWHGAQWTYVLWGAIMGLLICTEQMFDKKVKLPVWMSVLLVNLLIVYCQLWFRAATPAEALRVHETVFTSWNTGAGLTSAISDVFRSTSFLLVFLFAMLVFLLGDAFSHRIIPQLNAKPRLVRWLGYYAMVVMIVFLGVSINAPAFVYFQF
jgi:D-alanyl-lipoteichoic acid acyltransferase DltB (MBOAT superfamily)